MRPRPHTRTALTRLLYLILFAALTLLSAACSRGSSDATSAEGPMRTAEMKQGVASASAPTTYEEMVNDAPEMPTMTHAASTPINGRYPGSDASPPREPDPSNATPSHQPTTRQVIYESWMRLAVHDLAKALESAREVTERLGGFVQASASNRLVLRVPAARYDEAIASLKILGDVRSLRLTSQDVTDQYTDLVARIDNLRALKARYEALLLAATRMEDRLAIERELRRITQDLQVLEEQLVVLSDRLALSTITLDLERIQPQHLTRSTPPQPFAFARDYGAQTLLQ
jgi:hypothetical protein